MCISLDYGKGSWSECVRCCGDAGGDKGSYFSAGERICNICTSLPKRVFERSDPDYAAKEKAIRQKVAKK